MLACRLSAHEDWLYEHYRSGIGQAVVRGPLGVDVRGQKLTLVQRGVMGQTAVRCTAAARLT